MRLTIPAAAALAGLVGWGAGSGGTRDVPREATEWCDVWIPGANRTDLPRVLLVGDSITRGYYDGVAKRLAGKALVARLATSRSVCDPLFIAEMRPVVEGYGWSVIHFNNGIHGRAYGDKEYRAALGAALRYLEEKGGGARIVGVLSTPPRPGKDDGGTGGQVPNRNAIVRELCKEKNLPVNDLYSPVAGHGAYYRDRYHFKREAIESQAEQVAQMVSRLLVP